MRTRFLLLGLLASLPTCGGGGGADDPSVEPGTLFTETLNAGLAVGLPFSRAASLAPYLAMPVSEAAQQVDLNGDGDKVDDVVVVLNTETDEMTSLALATRGSILASASSFAFLVPESGQGYTDYNEDGDYHDAVWFVYEPARGPGLSNPVDTGIATPFNGLPAAAVESGYLFLESEGAQGLFLNGDLDQLDNVLAVYDDRVRAVLPIGSWTHATGHPFVARAGRVLVALSEPSASADLNNDNDQLDIVLAYVDFTVGAPILRPVGGLFPRSIANNPYALTDGAAVYLIDEASSGPFDFNGDGDFDDDVVAVFDIEGLTGERLPHTASSSDPAFAGAGTRDIVTSGERALIGLSEAGQHDSDLNGDGDAFDVVPAWIDTAGAPGTLRIVPGVALGSLPARADGEHALIVVDEFSSGAIVGVDFNGDGDTDDGVAFLLDMTSIAGTLVNLKFAVQTTALAGPDALLGVPELGHFAGDLNGNGVVGDVVTYYVDLADNPPTLRGLAVVAPATTFFRLSGHEVRLAANVPEGQSFVYDDLNGDNDEDDAALVLFGINPGREPPALLPSTPSVAGTATRVPTAALRVGDAVFAFPTSELEERVDLNGDGDKQDVVLRYVRYLPPPE